MPFNLLMVHYMHYYMSLSSALLSIGDFRDNILVNYTFLAPVKIRQLVLNLGPKGCRPKAGGKVAASTTAESNRLCTPARRCARGI